MILSIWIILTVIVSFGLFFFYKKNKFKLKPPEVNSNNKETQYGLTNIDKMLGNVTKKEKIPINKKLENPISSDDNENREESISKEKEKHSFDFKTGFITSILLEKKENL